MDFDVSLRRALKTGKVCLGQKSTTDSVKDGKAQIVVVAKNCPGDFVSSLKQKEDVFVYTYEGSSVQLGKACGKPFLVSALAVVEPGESDILSLKRV